MQATEQILHDLLVGSSQPGESVPPILLWSEVACGGLLLGAGLYRRDTIGLVAAGLGGFMAYHGCVTLQEQARARAPDTASGGPPPSKNGPAKTEETLDEALEESFPASDPPAYGR